jgi:hypothetical protein
MIDENEHNDTDQEKKNLDIPSSTKKRTSGATNSTNKTEHTNGLTNIPNPPRKPRWFENKHCQQWTLIAITAILAFVTGKMWIETHNLAVQTTSSVSFADSTLKFIKKNAYIENRAWIGQVVPIRIYGGNVFTDNGTTIQVFIKNFGKTPADSLRSGYKFFFLPNKIPPHVLLDSPNILSPTEEREVDSTISISDTDTIIAKKINNLCFYGIIIYKDFAGGKDTTEFLYRYSTKIGRFVPFGINRMK